MNNQYDLELLPLLHRILEVSTEKIHLQLVPNWPRDSLPKSPIIQKLGLIVISILYPWWCRDLDIFYEQFGPYSPVIGEVFQDLLDQERCFIGEDSIEIQPSSIEE